MTNTLWTGDNLYILNGMNSQSVDLIYLDPPFNSKRTYSAPVGSKAAGSSFKDMWTWKDVDEAFLDGLFNAYPALVQFIQTIEIIHGKPMMSYITYMAERIMQMHRVLKPTGSLYLHCDPTASHYLKIILDRIFGKNGFQGEITWKRYAVHSLANAAFDNVADNILIYAKDAERVSFNKVYGLIDKAETDKKFPHLEKETGRRFQHIALEQSSNSSSAGEKRTIGDRTVDGTIGWRWSQETFDNRLKENPYIIYWTKSGRPRYKKYADEYQGIPLGNIWTDVDYLSSNDAERTGYPTQKPLALLNRIIKASSNEGDVVFDPFCGCATACVAAQQLNRQWIGIDIEEKAAQILVERLSDDAGMFSDFVHRKDIPQRTDIKKEPPSQSIKTRLYKAQSGACNGCGSEFEARHFEIDHVIPKSKGGGDYYENYQLLCGSCNRIKGNRPMEYLKAKISRLNKAMENLTFGSESRDE